LTTAAVAFEEQRAATVVEDVPAAKVAPVGMTAVAPRASGLILGTLVLAQGAWLGVLGFVAYKLLT
jgi:hypothetical protein